MSDDTPFHHNGTTMYGSLESEAVQEVKNALEPLFEQAAVDSDEVKLKKLEILEHGQTVVELEPPMTPPDQ